ncbi:MAG: alpha-2-macroglobulin family protein, partial [Planctomycetota bacterium]
SPVPNAPVTYQVFRRRHWTPYWRRHVWHDWYGEEEGGKRWYGGYGQQVHQGQGKTDAQGRLALSHAIPREDHDAVYTVVAQVTDLGRRRIDGAGTVLATQAAFGLAIQLDRYVVSPKEPFNLTLRAATHDGDPVADQAVRLKVFWRRWDGKNYEEREVFRAAELRTNAQGEVTAPLEIPQSGYMRVEASARDARGNTVKTSRYLWIASPNWGGGYMNWQGVDIVADKETYEPGDTATFLVTSQVKDLALLFTLESDRIHHYQVVRLKGHTATIQVRLDKPAYIPNVYVAAMALHGGQAYQKQKSIQVNPSARFLTVEIEPDRKTYRPRENARFKITTRDKDGKPVAAEVALGVVDESLYALQPEFAADMRRFFVRRRHNQVQSRSSLQFWDYGRAEAKDEAGTVEAEAQAPAEGMARRKGKKLGAAASKYAATEIRARFADTMLWSPTVVTDENGEATVTLDEVADNLTTWRLTARGMGRRGLVGQAKNSILVRKDVIVRLQTPRFFTQGDRSLVSAVIRNDLDEAKDVKVIVEAEGIEVAGETTRTVRVAANGERRVDWTAYVGAPGKARVTVKALTDEASDAMRLDIPVLAHGSLQWTSRAGLVEQRVEEKVLLPDDAIPETTELLIVVSPTHAATVLDALDYLAGYPYGCVEQTMSRFLPTAITRQVLQQLQIKKPELEEELPHMLRAGLQRLYNFQHFDGGWGWWKNDQSNPFTTAYVVYGLAQAQRADVQVDANVLRRAIQALQGQLGKAEDDETRAYLLYALSTAGVKVPAVRNALADNLTKLPAATKAMVALVLHQDGQTREAKRVLYALAKEAVEVGAGAHWKGQNQYRWTSHSVETTALGLQALLAIDPDHALVKKVVTWLAMTRDGDHWVSTRQTAMVVYALAGYLARTGEREPDMTLTLEVNGTRLFQKRVTKDNWHAFDGTVKLTGAQLRPGENRIVLDRQGTGTPVYALYLKHFVKADKFEPSQGGVRIERTYARVTKDGKRGLEPLADGAIVESGEEIHVTLKVLADRPHRYLMLEDPMPAGFEAVREPRRQWYGRHWNYWYANKEYRDEKVDIAVTYLPQGERTVSYVMRAETPGKFRILPTLVWNMYRPGEGGNSAGMTIEVVDNG